VLVDTGATDSMAPSVALLKAGISPVGLAVTAPESVGISIDPATRTLKRLPAIPLKQAVSVLRL
jgi:hypothetical protein